MVLAENDCSRKNRYARNMIFFRHNYTSKSGFMEAKQSGVVGLELLAAKVVLNYYFSTCINKPSGRGGRGTTV